MCGYITATTHEVIIFIQGLRPWTVVPSSHGTTDTTLPERNSLYLTAYSYKLRT